HAQSSPGSSDWTMGCFWAWKCLVACLFFDESQQPTCPQVRHKRRWTQVSPIFRHSSQPFVFGDTSWIWSRWLHSWLWLMGTSSLVASLRGEKPMDQLHADGALAHRRGHPLHARGAHVADREDAGQAGLQQLRWTRERPLGRLQLLRAQVGAGLDEALVIEDG